VYVVYFRADDLTVLMVTPIEPSRRAEVKMRFPNESVWMIPGTVSADD
jgi:hypothetical protein